MWSVAEMHPAFNQRRVSQERLMGISFVDILIQAVFVLLIALMAGYMDPDDRKKLKDHAEVGKDLCQKINPDSIEVCREYVRDFKGESPSQFDGVGVDICGRLGATTRDECIAAFDKRFGAGSQKTCLKAPSLNSTQKSTKWELRSPQEVVFLGFYSQYLDYLRGRGDSDRLNAAENLNSQVPKILTPSEVESNFGFIREPDCYHDYAIGRTGRYNDTDLRNALGALGGLKKFQPN
jgi:hypothetical protein